ncbi:hypothetical protein FLM9_1372 [Candidatus Synechococcus spongiarum]|uniref:Uncharacterized protein n=1 Tax=Candidatus Synechococcus spongiarum TaxID=431041 RepID=A0A165B1Q8_9SYNE|nr:hypothetical protein FLM9_1372 [Candidatus Synechococcus spongiarum]
MGHGYGDTAPWRLPRSAFRAVTSERQAKVFPLILCNYN